VIRLMVMMYVRFGIVKVTGNDLSGASFYPLSFISETERKGGPAASPTRSQQ
jgi:hypothetical protein